MSDGAVIDANVMQGFYQELCSGEGCVYEVVCWLCNTRGIVASDTVLTEWECVCAAEVFRDWLADQMKTGGLKKVAGKKLDRGVVRKMRVDCGFPCRSRDIEYIKCANATTSTRYIVSEDMDFYDPTLKQADAKMKGWARDDRQGRFCRFLLDRLGIRVGTIAHCKADLGIP